MSGDNDTATVRESLPGLDTEEIDNLLTLLKTHRRTLFHYLRQQAMHSPPYTPPGIVHGIHDARVEIQRIKNTLRTHDISVDDFLYDEKIDDLSLFFGDDYIFPWTVFDRVNLEHFVGRNWLLAEVDTFFQQHDRGYFILEAEAGLGKTTFLAWLVHEHTYIHHFSELARGPEGIERGIKNLIAQLLISYKQRISIATPPASSTVALSDRLLDLLKQIADQREESEKIVLVVDALDEAGTPADLNVLGLPRALPAGVFIIVSQRPVYVRLKVDTPQTPCKHQALVAESDENTTDTRRFLKQAMGWPGVEKALEKSKYTPAELMAIVLGKCRGVWIYLYHVIQDIERHHKIPNNLDALPDGLTHYYVYYWISQRDKDKKRWHELYLPLLSTLAAAQDSVSTRELIAWSGVAPSPPDWELRGLLEEDWRPFLTITRTTQHKRYHFYHATLREFFEGKGELADLSAAEHTFIEALQQATLDAHERIIAMLRQTMLATPADASCRDAAFRLIRMDWLANNRQTSADELLSQLELVAPFADIQSQRDYLIHSIDSQWTAELDDRRRAQLSAFRAGLQGRSGRLEDATRDYDAASTYNSRLIGTEQELREDLKLAARIHLGAGNIAVILAEELELTDPDRQSKLQNAVESYHTAIVSANKHESNPVLTIRIYGQLIYAYTVLGWRDMAKVSYDKAVEVLNVNKRSINDPTTYAICRTQIMEALSQTYLTSAQQARSQAISDLEGAYQLAKEAIDILKRSFDTSHDTALIDNLALAYINAGDYLLEMSEYKNCSESEPLNTACRYWRTALSEARRAGILERQEQALERLGKHCPDNLSDESTAT
jgi:tetratricopeptide (TPR) repeat protein